MPRTTLLAIAAIAVAGTANAAAICEGGPRDQWMSKADVDARLAELGYAEDYVLAVEDGCIEAKLVRDGKRIEVYLEPITGEVAKIKG